MLLPTSSPTSSPSSSTTTTTTKSKATTIAQTMWSILIILATVLDIAELKLLTREQRQQMLDAHNYYRRLVVKEQGASNMQIMEWNADLEGFAYYWVSRCEWAHSPISERYNHAGEKYIGENIWATTQDELLNFSLPVKSWYDEVECYHYDTKTCDKGCGHYTQVVWYNSYMLGCHVSSKGECNGKSGMYPGTNVFVTCNYAPSGNWAKPNIFNKGDACSNCTDEWSKYCIDGLCSKVATEEELPMDGYKGHGLAAAVYSIPCLIVSLIITASYYNYY